MRKITGLAVLFSVPALAAVSIVNPALPNPIVGRAVSTPVWTLTATGGAPPYSWTVSAGSLPAGLALGSTGTITGTTFALGPSTFTAQVTDSTTATATQSYTITAQYAIGHGCTTATVIDWDCDYYGVGSAIGMDADDNNPAVNTPASVISTYGTIPAFLSAVKGYNPANIWYLSTTGNDLTCAANNAALPCGTFSHAVAVMSSGDALLVRGGTYLAPGASDGNYYMGTIGGTSGHPTIIMGYPGETAILDHGTTGWYGLTGTGSYFTVDGLVIQNHLCAAYPNVCVSAGDGVNFSAAVPTIMYSFILRNCLVRWWFREVWPSGGQNGTLIERNIVTDARGEHNIYIEANTMDDPSGVVNPVVQNNIFSTATWDNIHLNGPVTGALISGNIVFSSNTSPGPGPPAIAFQDGTNHSTVQNNIVIFNSSQAFEINDYYEPNLVGIPHDQNYNKIVNNTFIFSGRSTGGVDETAASYSVIRIANDDSTTPSFHPDLGHNTYQNNIVLNAAGAANWNPGTTWGGVMQYAQINSSDLPWWQTDTYLNNALYGVSGQAVLQIGISPGPDGTWTRTWAQFPSLVAAFTGNINVNPNLTAYDDAWYNTPERYNLAPALGSPAIAAGLAASAPLVDITGAVRSLTTPTIGAYEFGAAPPGTGGGVFGGSLVLGGTAVAH
jgi:putative Ig domain-containing protein